MLGGRSKKLVYVHGIEDKYLVLPLHTHMSTANVERIYLVIRVFFCLVG